MGWRTMEPEPREPKPYPPAEPKEPPTASEPDEPRPKKKRVKVKLRDGKERTIQHTVQTSFGVRTVNPFQQKNFE